MWWSAACGGAKKVREGLFAGLPIETAADSVFSRGNSRGSTKSKLLTLHSQL